MKSRKIKIEETKFLVLQRLIVMTAYIIGIVIAGSMIPGFSSLGVSLFASAGIIAVVLGFAAQQAFSNVISGIFIAMFEPIKVGDKVMIKDEYGTVEDITLRHTVIKAWDEKRIIIPNSRLSEEYIINYSIKDPKVLGTLDIGISYDSDIDEARRIMVEIALNHPDLPKKVVGKGSEFLGKDALANVRLIELTDFAQKV
jgi:small-conductance mechanosensitive channel